MARRRSGENRNIGLLILRIGLGIMFILHGYPKLFGGPEMWTEIGLTMQAIGITFLPQAFGFLAGVIEFFGGIFLMFGLFFRPTLSFLISVMVIAALTSMGAGEPFSSVSHPIEIGIVFISLLFIGPGKYSLANRLNRHRRRW
jgi:putative oxidoreductase